MSFATPLGWLAAGLAVPLTLWYLLRARRPRVEVSSTYLWRRADEAATAAVPWQRFRPDTTFWLVLAALLVGALALARPALPVEAALGDHTILVLDASASMLADEEGPTRLELARREGERLLSSLGPGQTVSVVEAAGRARVLTSSTGDAGTARRALAAVRPAQGAADLTDAFTLATALQRPGQSNVVHLLTDGDVPPEHLAAAPEALRVTAVGAPRPNLAVTRLQAVAAGAGSAEVFVQVRNFGALETTARLAITSGGVRGSPPLIEVVRGSAPLIEEVELDVREVALLPRGTADVVAELRLPDTDGPLVLRAGVEPVDAEDAGDALAVDDTAATVISGGRALTVLIAGPGNVFISSALAAVDGIELRTAAAVPADLTGVDLLVVDRVDAPAAPTVPTLLVAPTAAPDGVVIGAPVEGPTVTFQDPEHELLRDVDLSTLALASARPVTAPELQAVASGPAGTLIAAGRLAGQPVVHLAFDLLESNLPLEVAWPIFTANAVAWLAGSPAASPVTAGAEIDIALPSGVTGVEVTPPAGDPVRLDAVSPRLRVDQVGVWTPRWLGAAEAVAAAPSPAPIAVNAVPEEGDLSRPGPPADLDGAGGGSAAGSATPATGRRVIGSGMLVAVLVFLLAEWAAAHGVRPLRALRRRRTARVPT